MIPGSDFLDAGRDVQAVVPMLDHESLPCDNVYFDAIHADDINFISSELMARASKSPRAQTPPKNGTLGSIVGNGFLGRYTDPRYPTIEGPMSLFTGPLATGYLATSPFNHHLTSHVPVQLHPG
ncbi:BQ2448_1731 [Microbotryum intermedium]|uniref:BQ2448_1731 protein n=1 Tax=Microbotryum intermedium TaxID=269621 RepID=A0A238FAZ6_9BASI|nr:BQ2448_1731 [Microbotryum intermedium]